MNFETILKAYDQSKRDIENEICQCPFCKHVRRRRDKFRARLLRMYEEQAKELAQVKAELQIVDAFYSRDDFDD